MICTLTFLFRSSLNGIFGNTDLILHHIDIIEECLQLEKNNAPSPQDSSIVPSPPSSSPQTDVPSTSSSSAQSSMQGDQSELASLSETLPLLVDHGEIQKEKLTECITQLKLSANTIQVWVSSSFLLLLCSCLFR